MIKIAVYGKGGIGKSTTTSHIAAALSLSGYKVIQIGCDPKSDSTKTLMGGLRIPTALDQIRAKRNDLVAEDIVYEGFAGVLCVECGGPTPGVGCAGRGIITVFEKIESLQVFEKYKPDVVLFDVLGDVVCGGFAMPIRNGCADHVFIVTSGEMMSLYAAGNIAAAVRNFSPQGYAALGGVILNRKNTKGEIETTSAACAEMDVPIVGILPRSDDIQTAESVGGTVFEKLPDSPMCDHYRTLAQMIIKEGTTCVQQNSFDTPVRADACDVHDVRAQQLAC
jgi:nitrogenase iron protein NifH